MKLIHSILSRAPQTIITATSEDPFFPVANLKHQHRAKTWRSSGHWVIVDATINVDSEVIEIDDGAFNTEELRAEIEAKLQAYDPTFAVTYSQTSFRWTLAAENEITLELTPFLEALGFTAGGTGLEFEGALPAIHTSETITIDMRTSEEIDSVVLLWPIAKYKLSDSAVIKIKANATNEWASPAFEEILEFDDKNEVAQHHFAAVSFRYWQVEITDPRNQHGFVELGVPIIAKADALLTFISNGFDFKVLDGSEVERNKTLQGFVNRFPKQKVLNFQFDLLTLEETEALLEAFAGVGSHETVFITLDEMESLFNAGFCAIYGRLASEVGIGHKWRDNFGSGLSISEEG